MSSRVNLVDLVVEPGQHTHDQDALAPRMRELLRHVDGADALRKAVGMVYQRSEIQQRHVELDFAELDRRQDWYLAVNEATRTLSERTLGRLFSGTVAAKDCHAFIAVSSSHAGFPSLTREIQESMGFPLDATCFDVTGLGCAGPTHGIHLAHLLLGQPHIRTVCILCVDVMGTHGEARRHDTAPSMEQVVAHCLASDGAAAMVLSKDVPAATGLSFGGCSLYSRMWSNALDLNFFSASKDNQPYLAVGKDIRTRLLAETEEFFSERVRDEPFFMHPGGAALMARLEAAEPSLKESIDISRAVLTQNGNLGSPSVLWVWERALRRGVPMVPAMTLFALGPGIVTTAIRLEDVETVATQKVAA